ncbi:MAG: Crp/Fnr family transcriptional regulator [Gemmatimonadaceae bacterium]
MRNILLRDLPRDAYAEIEPLFQGRAFDRAERLHGPGEPIHDLYFPLDCLVSITVTMSDGRTAETGVVGSREVVGINAFMGGRETTQTEYVIQIPGDAIRVPAAPLLRLFDRHKGVRDVLLKYTQAMLAQLTQNAACNALHSLEQRYARWLLEARDRIMSDELRLTQEFISQMLGVRRAGVSEVAHSFEALGAVSQSRGRTRIVDGGRLEAASCECYRVLANEYDRLLGTGAVEAVLASLARTAAPNPVLL